MPERMNSCSCLMALVVFCWLVGCDASRSQVSGGQRLGAQATSAQASPSAHAKQKTPASESGAAIPPRSSAAHDFQLPDADGWGSAAGLRYLEVVKGTDAPERRLPLVILLHGLGDRARDIWIERPAQPMRLVMPQAPLPHGGGFAWFRARVRDRRPGVLAEGVDRAARQLARAIGQLAQHRPTRGCPIVGGFSQGGMLSYALALRHADLLGTAIPIAGMLPRPLWPTRANAAHGARPGAVVRALHGDADKVVPTTADRDLIGHLKGLGYDATLEEYLGVGHFVSPAMAARLMQLVEEAAKNANQGEACVRK